MIAKKRDTSRKRESILDAAEQAFVAEGYETASMDRIAEIAGASKRTVYNHFSSKEELFKSVLDRLMEKAHALKQVQYDPSRPLEAQLKDFARAKAEVSRNPSWLALMRVTVAVFISNPELARETMMRAGDAEDTLVVWLGAASADGRLDVPDPKLAAEVFWGMVSGALFWPALFFGPTPPPQAKILEEEIFAMFLSKYER